MEKYYRDLTIREAFDLCTDEEKNIIAEKFMSNVNEEEPIYVKESKLRMYIEEQPTIRHKIDREPHNAWDGFYY